MLVQMLTIASRLGTILSALRQAVAVFAARQNHVQPLVWLGAIAYAPIAAPNQPPRIAPETWVLLINRLGRTAARFAALFASWRAGTLPAPRPPHPGRIRPARVTPRLPAARGWLAGGTDHHVRAYGNHLQHLLAEPGMAEFVGEVPCAGRLLRPLIHALALSTPAWLALPPRPARVRIKPATPQAEPGTPDRPLPANIRAAVRAWKKFDK